MTHQPTQEQLEAKVRKILVDFYVKARDDEVVPYSRTTKHPTI